VTSVGADEDKSGTAENNDYNCQKCEQNLNQHEVQTNKQKDAKKCKMFLWRSLN
jgi:hypothetical protein